MMLLRPLPYIVLQTYDSSAFLLIDAGGTSLLLHASDLGGAGIRPSINCAKIFTGMSSLSVGSSNSPYLR
eukprot:4990240-Amphidinium_carterae.1